MPRLAKGETAGGIKAKSDSAKNSVVRRVEIFRELYSLECPPFDNLKFFKTTEELARWSCPSNGVFPVSVKTLRKYADVIYPGGLAALCAAARRKLNCELARTTKNEKVDYERKSSLAIDSALEMTTRYLDLLERMKRLSYQSNDVEVELGKHFHRYGKNPHVREVT